MKKRIKIWRDNYPANPFKEWDCEPDVMTYYDRGVTDYSDGSIVEHIKYTPSNNQLIRHQQRLSEILEFDLDWINQKDLTKDEKADEIRWEISSSCSIKQLSELCELFKIAHLSYTSKGYSQGDWSDVLIVLTDDFYSKTGCNPKDADRILKGAQKLYDAWAWGDVYGFTVETCKPMVKLSREDFNAGKFEEVEDDEEWEDGDSCGGFYGEDIEGIVEHSGVPREVVESAFYYENIDEWVEFEEN